MIHALKDLMRPLRARAVSIFLATPSFGRRTGVECVTVLGRLSRKVTASTGYISIFFATLHNSTQVSVDFYMREKRLVILAGTEKLLGWLQKLKQQPTFWESEEGCRELFAGTTRIIKLHNRNGESKRLSQSSRSSCEISEIGGRTEEFKL